MKYFKELECNNMPVISAGIYEFLKTNTDIVEKQQAGWHFVDCKLLLQQVPELVDFFKIRNLLPRHAAVTVVLDNNSLPKHIDELPVIAKINMPVVNTEGWSNRWYKNDVLVAELNGFSKPTAFNSQIIHSVEQASDSAKSPRIIASFTFHNEPLDLLK